MIAVGIISGSQAETVSEHGEARGILARDYREQKCYTFARNSQLLQCIVACQEDEECEDGFAEVVTSITKQ